ncbi:major capsid protein [Fadolivirus algeromassiliense]|jgi:hypothetical protein|uniref:Major capsid protein n=1 Tax=Fadolivirus FV1/VV64 TaxID=3070911 RepID=A0A7D3R0S2_9VIRU|nr:major capsid protein [Fadolivirus algeromassiliense]QKF93921.1 major capsid protein [Fadolivirus FV1/VV64]
MAGGLLQLIAYGAQDVYLTNDPQVTFFKVVYRRHTNFSIQAFEKRFDDNPDFGKKGAVKVYRLGDLASRMYLRVRINKITGTEGIKFAWIRRLGHAMIRQIDFKVGGNLIDRHSGTWLDIWYELARQGNHDRGYAHQIGDIDILTEYNDKDKPEYTLYIPLQFSFNRHPGLALPLIAIQYHEIYMHVEFERKETLLVRCRNFDNFDDVKILEVGLVTDYVYLDLPERTRFSVTGHEYLMEQTQYYGDEGVEEPIKRLLLDFNHPTKEIIWAMRNGLYTTGKHFLCYSNDEDWTDELIACSIAILKQSMLLLKGPDVLVNESTGEVIPIPGTGENPPSYGLWVEFLRSGESITSPNGNVIVINNSRDKSLWINFNSLMIGDYSITEKIAALISVSEDNVITVDEITSSLLDRDISFPVEYMTDTRTNPDEDICVYQFSNYGLFITGKWNPLGYALLEYNGQNRTERRNGRFFGNLEPWMHHSNTPIDGINLYSFAIEPEKLQPTGTSNLSKIENIILTLWFEDTSNPDGTLPTFPMFNLDNRLFVYAFSYNVFRVISGVTGLAYSG